MCNVQPNGRVLFRDYAIGDLAQVGFDMNKDLPVFNTVPFMFMPNVISHYMMHFVMLRTRKKKVNTQVTQPSSVIMGNYKLDAALCMCL